MMRYYEYIEQPVSGRSIKHLHICSLNIACTKRTYIHWQLDDEQTIAAGEWDTVCDCELYLVSFVLVQRA